MRQGPVPHIATFVCMHIRDGERPVLWVSRPDGDWCFLCGQSDHGGVESYCIVGMSHLVDHDATLREVLDLRRDREAERLVVGGRWTRSEINYSEGA